MTKSAAQSSSLRGAIPGPARRLARGVLRWPAVRSARRTARLVSRRTFDPESKDASRHGLRIVDDLEGVEALFAGSEANFEDIVAPYVREFRWPLAKIYNGFFESVDAELYYVIVRRRRPQLVIEIGSGNSTSFAMEAIRANGSGRIISIDPEPRTALPPGVEHLASNVEDVDPALFAGLARDDVLFIDSSHTTEEATYHVEHLLPALARGVLVHHHDVFFPFVRYHMNDGKTFGEPDVLLDFYRGHQDDYEVLVSASYVRYANPDLLAKLIRSHRWLRTRVPGSLWATRIR